LYICIVLKINQIITLILVVFISASASSIALFEHICKKEGSNTSLFVPVSSHNHELHDEDEHQLDKTTSSELCCHSSSDEDSIDEDCCDTDVKILKVDQQFYSEIQKYIAPYFNTTNPFTLQHSLCFTLNVRGKPFYRPPPVLLTPKRLALLQTYLI
jgi:hypothetical protein